MNRALRAATTVALLVSPLALAACSAGQVTQTASQNRDKVGGTADSGDVTVRALQLENPGRGVHEAGSDVELLGALLNSGDEPDTLTSITSESFEGVRVLGGSGTEGAAASSGSAFDTEVDLELPTDETVFLGSGDGPTVLLENLSEDLTTGRTIELTLTFETAGEIDVVALVANPDSAQERGEAFDFHHEEGELGEESLVEGESEVGSANNEQDTEQE